MWRCPKAKDLLPCSDHSCLAVDCSIVPLIWAVPPCLQWWSEPNSFHVCVTSYKLLLKDQREFLKKRWKHLVLDEVQLIKNMTEKHWDTVFSLKRWVEQEPLFQPNLCTPMASLYNTHQITVLDG